MFDRIAPDYDRLNHIMSLNIDKGWRRKAVKEVADTGNPLQVLDIACGTGDFTIEIARKLAEGSKVTGIDLSEGMMQVGREKMSKAGVTAEMVQGDCEDLPYPDNSFDRISVGFGVRNFEHLEIGLKEMYRVLKPEGKLVILELSIPENPVVRWCYKLYFLHMLPKIGGWISGEKGAYNYLPASVLKFPAPAKFAQLLDDTGFKHIKTRSLTFGICQMYTGIKRQTYKAAQEEQATLTGATSNSQNPARSSMPT